MNNLIQRISALEQEQKSIQDDIAPKQERLMQINEELRPLREERAKALIAEMGDAPDWPVVIGALAGEGQLSSVALIRYVEKQLEKYSMRHSGYWADTNEGVFEFKLTKDDPESYRKVLEGLLFFTPIFTPHPDGYVYFRIFEHNFSSTYYLLVRPDLSEAVIAEGRWNKKVFGDLKGALSYAQEHHWYDRLDGSTSVDED